MVTVLTQLSDGLADAVATAGQSIVRVEARRRLPGSGIAWSPDGLILTANHIVQRDKMSIGLADGETTGAELVGRDPATDLALLRADGSLMVGEWADDDSLRVGHLVLAVGRPRARVQSTLGIVSALGHAWQTAAGGKVDAYLQTDVVMYPGFSGGGLVDVQGRILGLNSSALARGISLTLPVTTLRRVADALLTHGYVRRGYLGIGVQNAQLPGGIAAQINQASGVLITSVESGSAAEQGGLVLGDTIVTLADEPIRHVDDLQAVLSGERVGQSVPVRIVRGGQIDQVDVVIGARS